MSVDLATELGQSAITLALMIATPILVTGVIVGLAVSIFQAVTQIQDQTLSFVPKIIAILFAALYVLPWIMQQMIDYSTALYNDIPTSF